jgi:hypothetical protein
MGTAFRVPNPVKHLQSTFQTELRLSLLKVLLSHTAHSATQVKVQPVICHHAAANHQLEKFDTNQRPWRGSSACSDFLLKQPVDSHRRRPTHSIMGAHRFCGPIRASCRGCPGCCAATDVCLEMRPRLQERLLVFGPLSNRTHCRRYQRCCYHFRGRNYLDDLSIHNHVA